MNWEEYKKLYLQYQLSISQIIVVNYFESKIFLDFPTKLPKELKKEWKNNLSIIIRLLQLISNSSNFEKFEELGKTKIKNSSEIFFEENLMYNLMFDLFGNSDLENYTKMNFGLFLNFQSIVMNFAYFDAFMADSIRIISKIKPEIMKSKKQIDWETIIGSGNWEKVLETLIEKFVYEFGWKTLKERISFIQKELKLMIDITNKEIEQLEEAENIRHIIVHNGGRVSNEFIERNRNTKYKLGEKVKVNNEYLLCILYQTRLLAGSIFSSISQKFFNIDENTIKVHLVKRQYEDGDEVIHLESNSI